MKFKACILAAPLLLLPIANADEQAAMASSPRWHVDFRDDFLFFSADNWQDQMLWVNDEDQCYVPDNQYGTREVSEGTLKLKVVDIGEEAPCDYPDKSGRRHPGSRYVAGRIASKNRQEFVKGKWTARLRTRGSGQDGMFPAWWLLGSLNNEPPVQESNEIVCWPMTGSGEIDIFEHHGSGGPDHYASRIIRNQGHCDGGDWESFMKVIEADLDEYHEYSVEWHGDDLIFRRDGAETYRIPGGGAQFPEPMFAVLNYAKYSAGPMNGEWVMEVDWVKHEYWQ